MRIISSILFRKKDYTWYRELSAGKGFADLVLIPRKGVDSPAIVIELKDNKYAESALPKSKTNVTAMPSKTMQAIPFWLVSTTTPKAKSTSA